ncbi:hypothetical protein B0T13DRAFT_81087 [Neurospora crassa]|nr:hypothetical protein B0T13DRAFT_81087 [Neurospora crassa]
MLEQRRFLRRKRSVIIRVATTEGEGIMCKGTRLPSVISGKSLDHFEPVGFLAMSILFYELRFFIPADFTMLHCFSGYEACVMLTLFRKGQSFGSASQGYIFLHSFPITEYVPTLLFIRTSEPPYDHSFSISTGSSTISIVMCLSFCSSHTSSYLYLGTFNVVTRCGLGLPEQPTSQLSTGLSQQRYITLPSPHHFVLHSTNGIVKFPKQAR